MRLYPLVDVAVMSAAVADYTPANFSNEKIKKNSGNIAVELSRTRDILKSMGETKRNNQVLVGFALETNNEREYALDKLERKNADLIILNSLNDEGAGFGHDTNKITIFKKSGEEVTYAQKSKQQVAKDIVDTIVKLV
jgi:phosphopantothenoylcysteine decarboxylase/phosphopantothenate--cysteine ligase